MPATTTSPPPQPQDLAAAVIAIVATAQAVKQAPATHADEQPTATALPGEQTGGATHAGEQPTNAIQEGEQPTAAAAHAGEQDSPGRPPVSGTELLDALVLLRWAQAELAGLEPVLIAAARATGLSWQALAPALGVASRQAAERRYLRSVSAPTDQPGDTRDDRVQAERDRRASHRAVTRWANDNTADLRRLAGQITALTDLDEAATTALARLHRALGDTDASALPALLAATHDHLPHHPDLAAQVDTITTHTDEIRRQPPRRSP